MFEEVVYHPEFKKDLETIHYHCEYNIPIKKEILYRTMPELYKKEIKKLSAEEKLRVIKIHLIL